MVGSNFFKDNQNNYHIIDIKLSKIDLILLKNE